MEFFHKPPVPQRRRMLTLGPQLVIAIGGAARDARLRVGDRPVIQPLLDKIHVGAICLGRLRDGIRRLETMTLPHETAANHPCEDAGQFGTQFSFAEVRVFRAVGYFGVKTDECSVCVKYPRRRPSQMGDGWRSLLYLARYNAAG
jgi:hypothetical protein